MSIREKTIERHLRLGVKARGGECMKFVSPGRRGVPDRIVLWPYGRAHFIELKAPGRKPSPGQRREAERLKALGFTVLCLDSEETVKDYVEFCEMSYRCKPSSPISIKS